MTTRLARITGVVWLALIATIFVLQAPASAQDKTPPATPAAKNVTPRRRRNK